MDINTADGPNLTISHRLISAGLDHSSRNFHVLHLALVEGDYHVCVHIGDLLSHIDDLGRLPESELYFLDRLAFRNLDRLFGNSAWSLFNVRAIFLLYFG